MKKYLISLDKDQHRRTLFFKQENTKDFELFSAINMMDNQINVSNIFNCEQFISRYSRNATNGEIGCTLSHLAIYQKIVDNSQIGDNEYCLICEDDALFTPHFQYSLEQLLLHNLSADILLVGQSKINTYNDIELEINYPTTFSFLQHKNKNDDFVVCYPYKNYFAGTVAYLIKKSAAKKILDNIPESQKPYWLADDFIFFEQLGLDIQYVRPLMVIENPQLNSNLSPTREIQPNNLFKKLLKYPVKKILAIKRNLI